MDEGGPFARPNLWAKSSLLTQVPGAIIVPLSEIDEPQTQWPELSGNLDDTFTFPATETQWLQRVPEDPLVEPTGLSPTLTQPDDAWSISTEDVERTQKPIQKSWEQYADPAFRETCHYLTEAGDAAFDAALRQQLPAERVGRPLKPPTFLKALFQLGLGRDSTLFSFRPDGTFSIRISNPRLYGLTPECTESIVNYFGHCGQLFRAIKAQISSTYRKSRSPPASVAIAQVVSSILLELDTQITERYPCQSFLQLESAFRGPITTLQLLRDLLERVWPVKSDQEALTELFDLAQEVERSQPFLKPLMALVLDCASKPWLRAVSACIGVNPMDSASESLRLALVASGDFDEAQDDDENDVMFPRWFSPVDKSLVRRTFEGMALLDVKFGPAVSHVQHGSEGLQWHFSWAGVTGQAQLEQVSIQASGLGRTEHLSNDPFGTGFPVTYNHVFDLENSYKVFEKPTAKNQKDSGIQKVVNDLFGGDSSTDHANTPSFEIAAVNSFRPLLEARARDINIACLTRLFETGSDPRTGYFLNFTYHLSILHRFLLMSDGLFTTRLSHALFDPDLASAERSKGKVRYGSMGLRLGSRSTWPPASSELQLALMGILTSAFENEPSSSRSHELPGDLSFALRRLSEDEIERCLDQKSLEALDFLRVQYRPPAPLDAVITQPILDKYDAVQRLLLRMNRLVFVVNHSFRTHLQRYRNWNPTHTRGGGITLRFIQSARHFVAAFTDYLQTSAILGPWTRFSAQIAKLEHAVRHDPGEVTADRGVAYIRALHEQTLDNVMFACLLRRRHERVRGLFEDICRLILRFAAMDEAQESVVTEVYGEFTKQVGVFVNVCKGLGERREYAGGKEEGLQGLVMRLTMNGFYSSNVERVLRL